MLIIAVRVRNTEIGKITMTTKLTGWHIVRTFAQHDHAGVLCHEDPTRRLVDDPESEHADVELGRPTDVVHCEDVMVLENIGHVVVGQRYSQRRDGRLSKTENTQAIAMRCDAWLAPFFILSGQTNARYMLRIGRCRIFGGSANPPPLGKLKIAVSSK
jgi:hypothetical protein